MRKPSMTCVFEWLFKVYPYFLNKIERIYNKVIIESGRWFKKRGKERMIKNMKIWYLI